MRRHAVILALILGLAGCVFPQALRAEHVLTGQPSAAHTGVVAIFLDGQASPPGAEEVAIVSATGSGYQATLQDVLGTLQAEAASLGATAVIRVCSERGLSDATATGVAVRVR